MKPGNFKVNFDGEVLSTTITVKPSLALKISLYFLNILFIAIIILFTVGGVGIIVAFIFVFEVLFLRYSIWNIHGSETITITSTSLSYQQRYGFIKLPLRTFALHSPIRVIPFHEDFQAKNKALKMVFEAFDEQQEPVNLYQTALVISPQDYAVFMQSFKKM